MSREPFRTLALAVMLLAGATDPANAGTWDSEPNQTCASATSIIVPGAGDGSLGETDGWDYATFVVSNAPVRVDVTLSPPPGSSHWVVDMRYACTTQMSGAAGAGDAPRGFTDVLATNGRYYVVTSADYGLTNDVWGSYELAVATTPCPLAVIGSTLLC